MIHAQLDANGICVGFGNLSRIENSPNLVFLPDGWNEDLRWRKYEIGAWSAEKFLPPTPVPVTDVAAEIEFLKQRDTQMQEDISAIIETMVGGI